MLQHERNREGTHNNLIKKHLVLLFDRDKSSAEQKFRELSGAQSREQWPTFITCCRTQLALSSYAIPVLTF